MRQPRGTVFVDVGDEVELFIVGSPEVVVRGHLTNLRLGWLTIRLDDGTEQRFDFPQRRHLFNDDLQEIQLVPTEDMLARVREAIDEHCDRMDSKVFTVGSLSTQPRLRGGSFHPYPHNRIHRCVQVLMQQGVVQEHFRPFNGEISYTLTGNN